MLRREVYVSDAVRKYLSLVVFAVKRAIRLSVSGNRCYRGAALKGGYVISAVVLRWMEGPGARPVWNEIRRGFRVVRQEDLASIEMAIFMNAV